MKLDPKNIHDLHATRLDAHKGNSWASGVYVTNNIVNFNPGGGHEGLVGLLLGDHASYAAALHDNTVHRRGARGRRDDAETTFRPDLRG